MATLQINEDKAIRNLTAFSVATNSFVRLLSRILKNRRTSNSEDVTPLRAILLNEQRLLDKQKPLRDILPEYLRFNQHLFRRHQISTIFLPHNKCKAVKNNSANQDINLHHIHE
jgi:hypothetical protein